MKKAALFLIPFLLAPAIGLDGLSSAIAETRKIGVLLPLTGPIAEYGKSTQNAFQMAMDEAPAASLPKLVVEDNKYEAKEAITALNKVLSIDNVDFIYNWGEDPSQGLAPIVEQKHIPLIAMSVNPSPAMGRKYVIRAIPPGDKFITETLAYVRAKGWKKFSVIKTEDAYFDSLWDRLRVRAANGEQIVSYHDFKPEDLDFRSMVTAVRPLHPDVVFVYLNPGQASTLAIQARNLGVTAPLFGTDIFESQTEIEEAHGALEGGAFVSLEVPDAFRATYIKRFGNDLQIAYAYNSYLMMKVMLRALDRPWVSRDKFMTDLKESALDNFKFVDSPEWGMYFDEALTVRAVKDGKLISAADAGK